MKKKFVFPLYSVVVSMLFSASLQAQNVSELGDEPLQRGWYIGIEGGLPFGVSTFSSFGHDKTHLGWAGGLYGGYRFNPVLSAEITARYGEMTLTSRDCCEERGYWLGSDGVRYNAAVLGMEGWNYRNLESKVKMEMYGARLNINLLGLFNGTRNSRWSVALSPHIYGVSTKTDVKTLSGGEEAQKGGTEWHLGYGGDVQVSYSITRHLQLGIYSGVTALTGKKMDAVPKYLHKSNYILESGLRLGFTFGAKPKKAVKETPAPAPTVCPEKTETPTVEEQKKEPVSVAPTEKKEEIAFPNIYFDFNKKTIQPSESAKLQAILSTLQAHPETKVTVKGWCDTKGSKSVNRRYSEARAKAVKAWLVERGIAADRIEVAGMGSDFNEADAAKARRASTEKQTN